VRCEATGFDLEDETVADDGFIWESDRVGVLGTGRSLSVADLPPGPHSLTVTLADSDGQTASTSVSFLVAAACTGDCDGDGRVSVAELVRAVNIALETQRTAACEAADAGGDGRVTINELVRAVAAALSGCETVGSLAASN
jgi:hypothetical protein